MKGFRVAVFEKSNPHLKYSVGFDFCDSIRRSGASFVLSVPYSDLISKYGLFQAMDLIKKSLANNNIEVLVFSLDNCFDFPPDFFKLINNKIYSCLYIGDDEHYFDRSGRYYAQCFDLTLSNLMLVMKQALPLNSNLSGIPSLANLFDSAFQ